MNVFIVTSVPFPFGMAPSKRILNYAKAINEIGVPCEVLSFERFQNANDAQMRGSFDGVPYKYFTKQKSKDQKTILYHFESILIRIRLLIYLQKNIQKGDIIIGYLKELRLTQRIIAIVHRKGAKYIQELCEIPAVAIKDEQQALVERRKIECLLFPKFDGIISISQALSEYAQKYTSSQCVIQRIPILVDYFEYNLDDKSDSSAVPYIFHSGTLTEQKDGFLGMLEAFGRAVLNNNLNAKFISTGSREKASNRNEISRMIDKYKIKDSVQFAGFVSNEELKEYLAGASLVIINKGVNTQNTYCFSTKLGEYMAAGKAIIITRVGEAMNWLTDRENAYIVSPNDNVELSKVIVSAFSNQEERKTIGENARKQCLKSFHYSHYGSVMCDFFNKLYNL